MDRLYFGTGGVPNSAPKRDSISGIERIRELGLDAMELEFVRGVKMSQETAQGVGQAAREEGVILTAHGAYFINLNGESEEKNAKSRQWVLEAARAALWVGGYSVTFHAASYRGMPPSQVYDIVRDQFGQILDVLKSENNTIWVRPELTGKPTYFGEVEELIRLSREFPTVLPCVDFAHLHARTNGGYNTYEEFAQVLNQIKDALGSQALQEMHIHLSGILYTPRGERKHVNLEESDLNYRELLQAFRDFDVRGVVICESPNLEEDALLMKATYEKLR